MQPHHLSVGIVTAALADCQQFYTRHFGFTTVFASDWYIQLRAPEQRLEIGLLAPQHPSQPAALQTAYGGQGAFINLEMPDVAGCYARLRAEGIAFELALCDEAWGERHFLLRDPAGMVVNVFEKLRSMPPVA